MIGFKKRDLDKIQSMSYEDKKTVIANLPPAVGSFLYSRYCSVDQLRDLFSDWDLIVSDPVRAVEYGRDIEKIQVRHVKKIKDLVRVLKKQRRGHLVPRLILDKYK